MKHRRASERLKALAAELEQSLEAVRTGADPARLEAAHSRVVKKLAAAVKRGGRGKAARMVSAILEECSAPTADAGPMKSSACGLPRKDQDNMRSLV